MSISIGAGDTLTFLQGPEGVTITDGAGNRGHLDHATLDGLKDKLGEDFERHADRYARWRGAPNEAARRRRYAVEVTSMALADSGPGMREEGQLPKEDNSGGVLSRIGMNGHFLAGQKRIVATDRVPLAASALHKSDVSELTLFPQEKLRHDEALIAKQALLKATNLQKLVINTSRTCVTKNQYGQIADLIGCNPDLLKLELDPSFFVSHYDHSVEPNKNIEIPILALKKLRKLEELDVTLEKMERAKSDVFACLAKSLKYLARLETLRLSLGGLSISDEDFSNIVRGVAKQENLKNFSLDIYFVFGPNDKLFDGLIGVINNLKKLESLRVTIKFHQAGQLQRLGEVLASLTHLRTIELQTNASAGFNTAANLEAVLGEMTARGVKAIHRDSYLQWRYR